MKPKPEFETPFEDSLAEFEMAPLPSEWKKELIDNAVSASAERKASRFVFFRTMAFGVLAACWVVTAILHLTTPTDPGFPDGAIARNTEIDPDDFSVLVAYFSRPHTSRTNL